MNQLVRPEPSPYRLCSCKQCAGGFITPRTARTFEWIADKVYDLLIVPEATVDAGAAVVDNFTSPGVLFMRPTLTIAMHSCCAPRFASRAVLSCVRRCLSCEHRAVPTLAHICSFDPAEGSSSTASAYFLVWTGSQCRPRGWPQDAAIYGLIFGGVST